MKRFQFLLLLFLCTLAFAACRENACPEIYELPTIPGWNIKKIGGRYWEGGDIVDFYFANKNYGYLTNERGDIYKTKNAGEQWEKLDLPALNNRKPKALFFYELQAGVVSLDSAAIGVGALPFAKLMRTNNGGQTWTIFQTNVRGKIKHMAFASPDRGVAIIQKPNVNYGIFYTNDGGQTWTENTSVFLGNESPRWTYRSIDPIEMYVVDVFNKVWKTDDGGETWLPLFRPENVQIHQIFAANGDEIYYTEDRGLFFYKRSSSTVEQLSENKTKILFFTREHAGITLQKPLDCNFESINSMDFNAGYRAVFARHTSDAEWVQSENSKILNNWKCNYVEGNYSYCTYKYFLYLIERVQ